ncbi:MAG TPA: hypothetical protein VJN88_14155 [Ktedonobacterales bacterium]|nr:hypothetical protein [Ktedonobacterales bacterium]
MQRYSCESLLGAVGRVLDEADVRRFSITDVENGLLVETFDGEQQLALNFGLPDLVELVDKTSRDDRAPNYERSYGRDESTLRAFLERHSLVGASR